MATEELREENLFLFCAWKKHDDYVGTLQSVSLGQTTRQSSDWRDSKNDYITELKIQRKNPVTY
jgi:hypothetical protein